jgi:hypothetical protein
VGLKDTWQRSGLTRSQSAQEQEKGHKDAGDCCRAILRGMVSASIVQYTACHLAKNQRVPAYQHHLSVLRLARNEQLLLQSFHLWHIQRELNKRMNEWNEEHA